MHVCRLGLLAASVPSCTPPESWMVSFELSKAPRELQRVNGTARRAVLHQRRLLLIENRASTKELYAGGVVPIGSK